MNLTLPEESPCPFCAYVNGESDAVFVSRGSKISILVNPRQYERGALLVIPNRHATSLVDATDEEFLAAQAEARRMARILVNHFGATGVNVFQNAGVHAGQTVAHYHVHVVPRYPTSEPGKRFREADYALTPVAQLEEIAAELNAPVQAALDALDPLDPAYERNPKAARALLAMWILAALGTLARIVATAGEDSWSTSPAYAPFTLAMIAGAIALGTTKRRLHVIAYAFSLVLFVLAVAMTL